MGKPLDARYLVLGLWILGGLFCGCPPEEEVGQFSVPEPRIATRNTDGTWTVEARPDDTFSTYHSLFAEGVDGRPVALRDLGGTLIAGYWNGQDWDEEEVGTTATVDEGDQLTSGIMAVDASGAVHALFTTEAHTTYYLSDAGGSWQLYTLPQQAERCYYLGVGLDDVARLLFSTDEDTTVVATLEGDGTLSQDVVVDTLACGSLDAKADGTVGVLLWQITGGGTGMAANLLERAPGASSWTTTEVLTNGFLCYECGDPEAYYIPQLLYRGDGVPVVLYVDSYAAPYLTYQGTDGLFVRQQLAVSQQVYQYTRLQRADDGTVGTAVVLDYTRIGLATSSAESGFAYDEVASGVEMLNPKLVWLPNGPHIAYWDVDGLWAVVPDSNGDLQQSRIDTAADYGYYLGSFLGVIDDGTPQVFYNEVHVVE